MLDFSSIKTLSLQNITKTFTHNEQNTVVLDSVNYAFTRDRTYALTGASGTGKSTLIHILAGLERPDSGAVLFDASSVEQLRKIQRADFLRRALGLVLQKPFLIDEFTVLENVMIKQLIKPTYFNVSDNNDKSSIKKEALALLDKIGLSGKAFERPSVLSGGEQQRVSVARALFGKPSFIIADEPTAHLDEETKKVILDLLLHSKQEWNMGLIVASHDAFVAQKMDTVLRLDKGQLLIITD